VTRTPNPAGGLVRDHAWGGNQGLDRVRLGLTLREVRRLLPAGERCRILEVGFGRGWMLTRLAGAGHIVHGVELGMLDLEVEPELKRLGRLHWGRIEDGELPADYFDLAYAIHVIEHVAAVRRTAQRLRDALRPGGRLLLITPNADSLGLRLFRGRWWNLEDPTHIRFFSPQSLTRLLEDAGFADVRVSIPRWDSVMVEPMSLARSLVHRVDRNGIMASRAARWLGLAALPITALARSVVPRLSASLLVTARRAG
jgi:2-polyprenyl-3-methyl-5-hydroxy-6-metoxy-1,4-benzoquinol methylase